MATAGAVAARLLLLLLMAAAAPSRARGSGCRSGAALQGVSTHWLCTGGGADGNPGSRVFRSGKVGTRHCRANREDEVKVSIVRKALAREYA